MDMRSLIMAWPKLFWIVSGFHKFQFFNLKFSLSVDLPSSWYYSHHIYRIIVWRWYSNTVIFPLILELKYSKSLSRDFFKGCGKDCCLKTEFYSLDSFIGCLNSASPSLNLVPPFLFFLTHVESLNGGICDYSTMTVEPFPLSSVHLWFITFHCKIRTLNYGWCFWTNCSFDTPCMHPHFWSS